MRRWGTRAVLLLGLISWGCAEQEIIVETTAVVAMTDADIDRDPWALLPEDAIGLVSLDAVALFQSQFGQRLAQIATRRNPLPPAAGFEPSRDLQHLYLGFYSMQGVDFAAVARGRFNTRAIEAAADGVAVTPLGAPVVRTQYAGRALYTSKNVGFAVLTEQTAILGSETAIRRALDRIREGRVKRDLPPWLADLLGNPDAPVAGGFDLADYALSAETVTRLPFVKGLQSGRLVGNFQPPGVNVAGTLKYVDEATAREGASTLSQLRDGLSAFGWLASILGIAQPVRQLEADSRESSTEFVLGLDGAAVGALIEQLASALGVTPAPVPVTLTPSTAGTPAVAPGPAPH